MTDSEHNFSPATIDALVESAGMLQALSDAWAASGDATLAAQAKTNSDAVWALIAGQTDLTRDTLQSLVTFDFYNGIRHLRIDAL